MSDRVLVVLFCFVFVMLGLDDANPLCHLLCKIAPDLGYVDWG